MRTATKGTESAPPASRCPGTTISTAARATPAPATARAVRAGILQSRGLVRFARQVAGPVPNLVDRLHEIPMPTLVLVGSEDPNFQRAAEVMTAKLPQARRVVVEGAGHVVNLDRPEALVREIEAFVASL